VEYTCNAFRGDSNAVSVSDCIAFRAQVLYCCKGLLYCCKAYCIAVRAYCIAVHWGLPFEGARTRSQTE
jgi:hypothetical protein